jgi:predicted transcriptional regulator
MTRSTVIAANVGRLFAFSLIFVGTWQMFRGNLGGGLWIALIGWFLDHAASVQLLQVTSRGLLTGHRVSQAMNKHYAAVSDTLTLQQLFDEQILGAGQRCFLVERQDKTLGLITLHQIKKVPRPKWATTSAAEVMIPFAELKYVDPDTELWSALQQMDRGGVNQMPVVRNQRALGTLSREDAITYLRTLQELDMSGSVKNANAA